MGVAEEGGSGTNNFSTVLPRGVVVNLGVDGSDATKTRGGTRGFPASGDGDDGSWDGGQDLEKLGGI